MQIGLCTSIENADRAIAIGYDYVVLSGTEISALSEDAFMELNEHVHQEHIKILAFNGLCPAEIDMVGDGYSKEASLSYMNRLIRRGATLGVKNIGVGAPNSRLVRFGYDRALAWKHARDFISMSAELAALHGMIVSVEELTRKYCSFINTLEESRIMAAELGKDNVRLIIDFFHMRADGIKPEEALSYLCNAGDVHVSGIDESTPRPGRPYLTRYDEDWLNCISMVLKKAGYDKTISVEPDPVTDDCFVEKASATLKLMRDVF